MISTSSPLFAWIYVTMAADFPDVRELSGPDKTGLELFHRDESVMLPDGCQVLNMSILIPGEAILGGLSSSLDE